jgi:hypothetical protein
MSSRNTRRRQPAKTATTRRPSAKTIAKADEAIATELATVDLDAVVQKTLVAELPTGDELAALSSGPVGDRLSETPTETLVVPVAETPVDAIAPNPDVQAAGAAADDAVEDAIARGEDPNAETPVEAPVAVVVKRTRKSRPMIWRFASTGEAYNAVQTDDTIADGGVLVVASESVVGFLAGAWPVAVTSEHGEFHTPGSETVVEGNYAESLAHARKVAETWRYELAA